MTWATWLILAGVALAAFYIGESTGAARVRKHDAAALTKANDDGFTRGEAFGRASERRVIREGRSAAGFKAADTRKRKAKEAEGRAFDEALGFTVRAENVQAEGTFTEGADDGN